VPKRATRGEQSRTEVITVRLTKAERTRLEQRAAAAGLTVSAFSAQALNGGRVTVETKPAAIVLPPELVAEFKRIGNNLNQIAYALNARKAVADGGVAKNFLDFVRALLRDQYLSSRAAPIAAAYVKSPPGAGHGSPSP
jgi:hypothetical protein